MTYNANDWKPGDVAMVKYRWDDPKMYLRQRAYGTEIEQWVSSEGTTSKAFEHAEWHRRLVVIDPEDREQVKRLRGLWDFEGRCNPVSSDTDDLQAALRKFANPTPPKPKEPIGLGAVVRDRAGVLWTRYRGDTSQWASTPSAGRVRYYWASIDAVEVLSAGWSE